MATKSKSCQNVRAMSTVQVTHIAVSTRPALGHSEYNLRSAVKGYQQFNRSSTYTAARAVLLDAARAYTMISFDAFTVG
jgi:hypothetical protein